LKSREKEVGFKEKSFISSKNTFSKSFSLFLLNLFANDFSSLLLSILVITVRNTFKKPFFKQADIFYYWLTGNYFD